MDNWGLVGHSVSNSDGITVLISERRLGREKQAVNWIMEGVISITYFRQMMEEISDEPTSRYMHSFTSNRQRCSIYRSLYRDLFLLIGQQKVVPHFTLTFSHSSSLFYRLHILMTSSCQIIIISSFLDSSRLCMYIYLYYTCTSSFKTCVCPPSILH